MLARLVLELLTSDDPPVSVSQSAGITDVSHRAQQMFSILRVIREHLSGVSGSSHIQHPVRQATALKEGTSAEKWWAGLGWGYCFWHCSYA